MLWRSKHFQSKEKIASLLTERFCSRSFCTGDAWFETNHSRQPNRSEVSVIFLYPWIFLVYITLEIPSWWAFSREPISLMQTIGRHTQHQHLKQNHTAIVSGY